jgi:hypothetical protein
MPRSYSAQIIEFGRVRFPPPPQPRTGAAASGYMMSAFSKTEQLLHFRVGGALITLRLIEQIESFDIPASLVQDVHEQFIEPFDDGVVSRVCLSQGAGPCCLASILMVHRSSDGWQATCRSNGGEAQHAPPQPLTAAAPMSSRRSWLGSG